jgi:membrane protein YqaA with SNARE-associated domain
MIALQRVHERLGALCGHRHATTMLAAVSFADSSFLPLPPDIMLVPMALARPDRAWHFGHVCTASSVLGGLLGYAIGYAAYDGFGRALIEFYGYGDEFDEFRALFAEWGFWIILLVGKMPVPYKFATIASGLAGYNLVTFVIASIVSRGIRFYVEVWLLRRYGAPIRGFTERHLAVVTVAFVLLTVGGLVFVRYAP